MFRFAYDTGAKLHLMNKQNLTPLTLAAKLAKKRMFEQILKLESNILWQYGDAASTAFPLGNIDTINQETGELNEDSALSLIVYGESNDHLDLLDGLVEELLQAKWKAFGRKRWVRSLIAFTVYYFFFFAAFMSRPFTTTSKVIIALNSRKGVEGSSESTETMYQYYMHNWYVNNTRGLYNTAEDNSDPYFLNTVLGVGFITCCLQNASKLF
ncbi:Transient receptor potential cation channel subfamily V member 6 [Aphelenchoides bicaudatus]|nr:Transient receptor potential cation channel subfamily V member 6 [Aphelenchoides bicaudatus]